MGEFEQVKRQYLHCNASAPTHTTTTATIINNYIKATTTGTIISTATNISTDTTTATKTKCIKGKNLGNVETVLN